MADGLRAAPRGAGAAVLLAAVVGTATGGLTAFAQGWLPAQVGSLANSAGSWVLVAFLLALLARRPWVAAACAAVAMVALVTGYYAVNELRGFPSSTRAVLFWTAAAVLVGPPLGLAAQWLRGADPVRAALGVGLPAGVLIGEGVYGLRYISGTTYPPYWRFEIACGVALLVAVSALRLRRPVPMTLSALAAGAVAVALVGAYTADLLALL